MSIRNLISNVKNYWSNLLTQQPRQEEAGEGPSNRFQQGIFGCGVASNASRKRLACNVFEPEITDDEDEFPGGIQSYQSYPPYPKRLRPDLEYEMTEQQRKIPTRASGIPPTVEGVASQPWEFSFKSKASAKSNQAALRNAEPSTSKMASRYAGTSGAENRGSAGRPPYGGTQTTCPPVAGTSGSGKKIEVITLDDDVDRSGVTSTNNENSNTVKMRRFPTSKSKEKPLVKTRLTSPMKETKTTKSQYTNKLSEYLGSFSKRLTGPHSTTVRLKEKLRYQQLLMAHDVLGSNGAYKNFPLVKTKVEHRQLSVAFSKCLPSSSDGSVSLRFDGRPLDSAPYSSSPYSKPTTALLPRLFSTPIDNDYSTSPPQRLAIQPTPEVVDLEVAPPKGNTDKNILPVTPVTSRRSDGLSSSFSPTKGAGNYSNLEDALNNSGALLLDDLSASEPLAIEAGGESSSKFDTDSEKAEDEDISIIAERVVSKSRKKSVNTLALEQTSCRYVDKRWLDDSKLTWRENRKNREDRIREETETINVLRRESTLEKDLDEQIRRKLSLTGIIVLEEPPQEIPELTDEILAVIKHAKARGNDNEVLAQVRLLKDTISITRGDIRTLGPSQWLNDNVINTYMGLIVLRSKLDNYPSVYAFQTFFYPKLLKEGYSNSLKRWTRKDDIFAHDVIILPIHLGLHWCLACVDLRKKSIRYFDSLGGDNQKCLHSLLDYISKEMKERKQRDLDKSEWKLENVKGIPQQQNGSDCGMFACKFAEYLSRDSDFTFSQEHMPYFRDRMIYELIRQDLMHP